MDQNELQLIAVNLRLEGELLNLLDLLAGLRVVVFKGPLLTKQIYGDLRYRQSCDNDLWVPAEHLDAALERLLQAGYLPLENYDSRLALKTAGQVALWPGGDLGYPSADLHAQPFSVKIFHVEEKFLEQYLVVSDFHGVPVRQFSPVLAMAHLCAHSAQHFFVSKQKKEVRDAFFAFNKAQDLAEFEKVSRHTCSLKVAQAVLLWSGVERVYVSAILGKISPLAALCAYSLNKGPEATYFTRQLWVLFLRLSPRIIRSLIRAIFPTKNELSMRYDSGNRISQQWKHLMGRARK